MTRIPYSKATDKKLRGFGKDRRGATSIEYAIIAGVLSLGVIASTRLFLEAVGNMWESNASQIEQTNG